MWEYFIRTRHGVDVDGVYRWLAEWETLIDGEPSEFNRYSTCILEDKDILSAPDSDTRASIAEFVALIQVIRCVHPKADTWLYTSQLVADAINGRTKLSGILSTLTGRAKMFLEMHIGTGVDAFEHVKVNDRPACDYEAACPLPGA